MKKVMILAAAAALVLAGCSKNEITENPSRVPENMLVGFSTYTPRAITKADANYYVDGTIVTNLVSGKTFGVYAWNTANATTPWSVNNNLFNGSGTPDFMNNVPVTFNGATAGADGSANISSAGYYSADNPVRYWPSGDTPDGLSFFAYYPANATGLTLPANGLGATTFQVRSTSAAQIDYMVSNVVADQYYGHTNSSYSSGAAGTVDLTFHHTLTKVQFKFKTDLSAAELTNTTVKLTGASLSGIFDTNVLTTGYSAGASANTGTFSYTWGTATNAAAFDITVNNAKPVDTNVTLSNSESTVGAADVFLMVPQDIAADQQKISLTWTVTTAGHTTTNTKTFDLNDIKNGSADIDWGMNQQITYTITVGPKPVYFTATVANWDTETTGSLTVN